MKYLIISGGRTCKGSPGDPAGGYASFPEPGPNFYGYIPNGYKVYFKCRRRPDGTTPRVTGPYSSTCQDGSWSDLPGRCPSEKNSILLEFMESDNS